MHIGVVVQELKAHIKVRFFANQGHCGEFAITANGL
jgi:hypothetical protein